MINAIAKAVHGYAIRSCEMKAINMASRVFTTTRVANIGGGIDNQRWTNARVIDAIIDEEIDFNTKPLWYDDGELSLVVCEQVIEHLHNTSFFLSELFRVLSPGGHLILSTENLASIPNMLALLLQRAPFSTQHMCGRFVGGWRDGVDKGRKPIPENLPTYSGINGHVRVMTTRQVKIMLKLAGFKIVSKHGFGFNHYILIHAVKP